MNDDDDENPIPASARILSFIVVAVVILASLWTIGAFTAWEPNPGLWNAWGRFFTVLFGFIGLAFVGLLVTKEA